MSVLQEISINVRNMRETEMTALERRAHLIKEMLRQGVKKPYKYVIDVAWGDPHEAGMKPLTFVRQVLAACFYPQLMDSDKLPVDVKCRARKLLHWCEGGCVGSYTNTPGITEVIHSIAHFITQRDGGVPADPDNIWIHAGSQWSLTNMLRVLVNSESSPRSGVLMPVPCYSTAHLSVEGLGGVVVPYFLDEEHGWELQIEELHRALESAQGVCKPVALYIINPGNPTGHIQSRGSIQEVIRFAWEKKLFLLADEVYQSCVHGEKTPFVSYKKVLSNMGPPLSDMLELASFHSTSKGFLGECGLRGGFVELVNMDPAAIKHIHMLFHTDASPPVAGQIALELMADPPKPGEPSYPLYTDEIRHIQSTMLHNVKKVEKVLNQLPGFSCQPVEGGAFAFPRLHLPPKAIQKAKEAEMKPDTFYCVRLLEDVGVFVSPGCEFGQKEGTYHIRLCIMTTVDTMEELLRRLSGFHLQFMKDFS
ncbi:alanine aminotransferase 2-like [Dunckerocampus dactyliophorus]|uniref:alanine aminotransferase 2-like n=1 Tax=Dunckerocampus dactyliophorus TaxID=161453 RepID=UPI002404DBF4|nr:alanine aminotransferase 2-like [Dunckerocampus dactyliophorus]